MEIPKAYNKSDFKEVFPHRRIPKEIIFEPKNYLNHVLMHLIENYQRNAEKVEMEIKIILRFIYFFKSQFYSFKNI